MVQVLYVEQRAAGAPAGGARRDGFDPTLDEALEGAAP
jgi:hypothetical protein